MTLESIEKLRELPVYGSVRVSGNLIGTKCHMVCAEKDEVNEIADEIEAEIERDFMKLPVDAEGVPIQIGDLLESSEINKQFMCRGMSLVLQSNEKWWTVEWSYDHYYGTSEYVSAKSCRHVKPRTIEDVLRDMLDAYDGEEHYELPYSFIAKYADELRELMEVGE